MAMVLNQLGNVIGDREHDVPGDRARPVQPLGLTRRLWQ